MNGGRVSTHKDFWNQGYRPRLEESDGNNGYWHWMVGITNSKGLRKNPFPMGALCEIRL